MTREDAISIMNVIVHMLEPQYDTDRIEDAVEIAIKALEQEPCEDAISRQAVLNLFNKSDNYSWEMSWLKRKIEKIPPVKPQEPFDIETYCKEHFCVMVDKDIWEKAEKALKQEPKTIQEIQAESEKYQKAFEDGYEQGYAQARFDYEQEPCEDAISRKALLEEIENGIKAGNYEEGYEEYPHINDMDDIIECIKYADSIQPKPKTGHWEWVQYDSNPNIGNWHCSECRCVVVECVDKEENGGIPLYKYCPQCGVRMVNPQESEESE